MGYSMSLIGPSRHAALRSPTVAFGCTLDMAGPAAGLSRSRMTRRRHGHRVSSEPSLVHSLEPYCASRPLLAKVQYREGFRSGSRGLRLMSNWAYGLRVMPDGFWRPLIAIVLAHAVAVQALLIALGGFSLAANADQSSPAFELCSHDANGATSRPISRPFRLHSLHLLLCRSAPCGDRHRALSLPSRQSRDGGRAVARRQLRRGAATRYTIASPRGPPLDA